MKPKNKLLIIFFALALALTGCQAKEKDLSSEPQENNSDSKVVAAVENDPREDNKWSKLSEISLDFDSDGKEENLELLTMAQRDEQGNIMWDDGQKWLLMVQDDNRFYPLLSEYVQLGSVYFNVSDYGEEAIRKITVIVSTTANFKMTNYVYDENKQGYREEPVYNSQDINFIFSSIPYYQ